MNMDNRTGQKIHRCKLFGIALAINIIVAGCVPPPARYAVVAEEETTLPPPVTIYFYPTEGQSPDKQDRDKYDCYLWARNQTGFDPSAPYLAPHHKLSVVADRPPGTDTAVGAITGALLGATVASRGNRPEGALIGATAGALIGSASDASRQEQTERLQRHYDMQSATRLANIEQQAADYRRAMKACLQGKGYIVE